MRAFVGAHAAPPMHANPNAPIEIILTLAAFGAAAFWWWSLRRLCARSGGFTRSGRLAY